MIALGIVAFLLPACFLSLPFASSLCAFMEPHVACDISALALVEDDHICSLRIGPKRHGYVYTRLPGIRLADRPVYRCCRGRDESTALLHLYFSEKHGCWVADAFEVEVGDVAALATGGAPAFRAAPGDVTKPGWHDWQCYDLQTGNWWAASAFETVHLTQ